MRNPGRIAAPAFAAKASARKSGLNNIRDRIRRSCQHEIGSVGDSLWRVLDARARGGDNRALSAGLTSVAGWSSVVARWANEPKDAGSNPAPATNNTNDF